MKLFTTTREIEKWTAEADMALSNMWTSANAIAADMDLPTSVRTQAATLAEAIRSAEHEFMKLDTAIARENP